MTIELDSIAKALYLRLASGRVAETIELAQAVVGDLDESGTLLGIKFVRIDQFVPYVAGHPDLVTLPSILNYHSVDREKSWQVEVGAGEWDSVHERRDRVAALNGIFLADLAARPKLIDQIAEGATIRLELTIAWN